MVKVRSSSGGHCSHYKEEPDCCKTWYPFGHKAAVRKIPQIGRVKADSAVVSTTHLAAVSPSALYLAARSEVVEPAGMAARNTETPVTSGSISRKRHGR